jgi:hypothetical protein
MTVYSYVVDHDEGYAPNPTAPFCTLVHCKFAKGTRRNIVESAEVGDWIVGTGGGSRRSSGAGTLIYVMQVTEKLAFEDFIADTRFAGRIDHHRPHDRHPRRFALISTRYAYFGASAPSLRRLGIDPARIAKRGPGHRKPDAALLDRLLAKIALAGQIGLPCMSRKDVTDSCSPAAPTPRASERPRCAPPRRCAPVRGAPRRRARTGAC